MQRQFVLGLQAAGAATYVPEAGLPAVDTHSTQALFAQEMDGKALSEVCLNKG